MMLLPPSANPALELSPLIWLVQPPKKSPEFSQFGSQCSKNKDTLKMMLKNEEYLVHRKTLQLIAHQINLHYSQWGVNALLGGFHAQRC